MTARLSIVPSAPTALKGVTLTVYGEVDPQAAVTVRDADSPYKLRAKSVVFSQGARPTGTGEQAFTVDIDADSGEFSLYLYTDGGDEYVTDPIYYYNDGAPDYLYPDSDDVADAINEALGDGTDTTVSKIGGQLIVLIGGKWSGKDDLGMEGVEDDLVGGAGTVTVAEIEPNGGPFVFGPLHLAAGDYVADLQTIDEDQLEDGSQLVIPQTFTVSA
jgi:hypothetical protein